MLIKYVDSCRTLASSPACLDQYLKQALQAGARHQEIAETVFISAAINAGAVAGYGLMTMGLLQQYMAQSGSQTLS